MPKMDCEKQVRRLDPHRRGKTDDPFGLEEDEEDDRAPKFSAEEFGDMDRGSVSPPANEFAAGSESDDGLDWSKGIGIENDGGGGGLDDFMPSSAGGGGGGDLDDFNPSAGSTDEDFLKF